MTGGANPQYEWAPAPPQKRRSRTPWLVLGIVAVAVVLAVVATIFLIPRAGEVVDAGPQAPKVGDEFLVASDTEAAKAAASGTTGDPATDAAAYLSAQPTAVWLTPERYPLDTVRESVAALADEAREQDATLTVVIYGLPERDCGQFSAGGLSAEDYPVWTAAIGEALRAADGVTSVVILEPDSLALAPECGNVDERAVQLRGAVESLTAPTTWIYLDGGHSNWLPFGQMAGLIKSVGVTDVIRGFATNVSNYNDAAAEFEYAHDLSRALGGAHAVIDTSRSGAGSNGEWCNPSGRLIGERAGTFGDEVVDTNLWIKVPGESDGTCNGGPEAGAWWPQSAIELTREAVGTGD